MRDFEEKLEVLRNKNKLRGIECYIDNDMTKEERSIQATLRRRAKEEAEKGHTVRVGYRKIQINGRWQYLDRESTRNGDSETTQRRCNNNKKQLSKKRCATNSEKTDVIENKLQRNKGDIGTTKKGNQNREHYRSHKNSIQTKWKQRTRIHNSNPKLPNT
ncbi:hypothetical protein C0J52_23792 [Blattella germanica]|nr:hypothetical protein C0J52_23792 [Blattella germanica]